MTDYMIYCKSPESKRFHPLSGGHVTHNLIHADHFPSRTLKEWEKLQSHVESLRELNSDCVFELRATPIGQRLFT